MNLLELVPGISEIISRLVPDPNQKLELELALAKIKASEIRARMGVLRGMMSNKSVFVAGAIPALIWLAVLGLLNNYVLGPWFDLKPINFPDQYWSLLTTVIVGLFGKKIWDGNEFRWPNGNVMSPSKSGEAAGAGTAVPHEPGAEANFHVAPQVMRAESPEALREVPSEPQPVPGQREGPRSQEEIDARLAELDRMYRKEAE